MQNIKINFRKLKKYLIFYIQRLTFIFENNNSESAGPIYSSTSGHETLRYLLLNARFDAFLVI